MLNTKLRWLAYLVGLGILIFLATFRQPYYPTTWFDEGLVLQGAINLVQHGQYAMRSVEGYRVLDQPLTANGPGIVLPISAVFTIWGVGLLQARLLMAFYLVLAVFLFNRVTKLLSGEMAALLSTLVLLVVPDEGFLLFGRQALGNVPALVYFLAGCYFFIKLLERKSSLYAYLTGGLWGLTLVTKSQYWIVLPVLGIIILLDLLYYKQVGIKSGVILITVTLFVLILWQFMQFMIIGRENYGQYVEAMRSSARVTVFAFRAVRIPGNIWYLIRSGFLVFVIPGLMLSVWDVRSREPHAVVRVFLVIFVVFWASWYVFVSVGWHRYAFEAYSIGTIFFGAFFLKMLGYVSLSSNSIAMKQRLSLPRILATLFLAVSCIWGVVFGFRQVQRILFPPEPYPQLFAEYLRDNIPPAAVIESWEWEIDALTPGLTYHHPTNDWVDRKTAETQFGEVSSEKYQPLAFAPTYLIDGPFSKWTGLYKDLISSGSWVQIVGIGDYTLYELQTDGQ